tara:strand:+ start:2249 stop:2647 length:399 start_codon:yes stop_codon:yes gene_type:complete
MKNIETPLTWGLGILAIVLIFLSSLNTTSADYNMGDVKSDANNGFDLNHDHEIQEASVYSVGDWGKNSCSSEDRRINEKLEELGLGQLESIKAFSFKWDDITVISDSLYNTLDSAEIERNFEEATGPYEDEE